MTMTKNDFWRTNIGTSLKLRYRTVLDISAASATTTAIQKTDQRQSAIGDLIACTVAAISPAAAGHGNPMKNREPLPGAIPWILNRASRHAQQITKERAT